MKGEKRKKKMLGIRIIREKTYRHLLKFKSEVEEILKKRLPVISDKTLEKKNIVLKRGLVLVKSTMSGCNVKYRSVNAVKILTEGILHQNIFTKEK